MQSHGKQVPIDGMAARVLGSRPDAVVTYTDRRGHEWMLVAELKSINGRPEIATLVVHSAHANAAVNRRLLRELPLGRLFGEVVAAEARFLNQRVTGNKRSTAHQGRRHTDDELRAVVNLYMDAQRGRRPVQATVAKALGISVAAANRRIIAARRRGLFADTPTNPDTSTPDTSTEISNQQRKKESPNDNEV